jgi:tRNA pseudouridine32 synthase/23S rRNA pseudouridine746 synthase
MKVIFESDDFIAVDKEPGWLTVPSRTGVADPRPCLGLRLAQKFKQALWPIHRLDVDVSGLVLFAKNAAAHREANSWFEKRLVRKNYEAWTEGTPPEGTEAGWSFEWHSVLLRGKRRAYRSPNGKAAATRATWVTSQSFDGNWVHVWKLEPLTGRAHQLRFELADHGCPILGDALYGAQHAFPYGIALRSLRLDLRECLKESSLKLPEEITVPGIEAWLDTLRSRKSDPAL